MIKYALENKYKKKKFANIIKNYFDKNHITYIIDESYSGSMYFKFKLSLFKAYAWLTPKLNRTLN